MMLFGHIVLYCNGGLRLNVALNQLGKALTNEVKTRELKHRDKNDKKLRIPEAVDK